MEYVGELLDYKEFLRRTKQYAKRGLQHHYFMALNSNELIDATLKGSNSRFLNHSCDPNCETQKVSENLHCIYTYLCHFLFTKKK